MAMIDTAALIALVQVILIDVMLSGDNAVVIGLAVSGLPVEHRARVIAIGVGVAAIMRAGLTLVAVPLLEIIGLTLAGGILLLYVAWKMWRELRRDSDGPHAAASAARKSAAQAMWQIMLADISMSLDNVLGVAGAARNHPYVLFFGLALSVVLMTVAANMIARLLDRYRWLAYVGLAVVAIVAVQLIHDGGMQVWRASGR
ncbi:MAG TPA: YjbE family putative metal transport protein [Candidatus Cybelea sp.]|nr:YjbE family putative metal transport protein [Candidatus Cybelea sp.]